MTLTEPEDRTDRVFRALASRPRREILKLLATGAGEGDARCCGADEVCACVFAERLSLSAPTVSHHMKALVRAGLVSARKDGLWVYYRLCPQAFTDVIRDVGAFSSCECPPEDAR